MKAVISHYQVLKHLGSGGLGEVYQAEDRRLRRTVALKVLPSQLTDPAAAQRLLEEAQAAAALNHPNIATIFELSTTDGVPFIAMEYVAGETLAHQIERGPLALSAALDIASQIADALAAAHELGLIHCDIKSANLMLTQAGQVKVLDFGLAKWTRQVSAPENSLKPGEPGQIIAGTAGYMSPEQVRGEPLDARTDLFSLGVVLYEMIAGHRPFGGPSRQELWQALLHNEVPPLGSLRADVPLELESIIRRALAKERADRYQSAPELLAELRRLKDQLQFPHPQLQAAGERRPDQAHAASIRADSAQIALPFWRTNSSGWLLSLAGVAALAASLDLLLFESHSSQWLRPVGLSLLAVLGLLASATLRRPSTQPRPAVPTGAAFRGLLPFQEADRDRFYGREFDTDSLFELITHQEFRFGVLYGDSGGGKTSLIKAGLLPKLWETGYVPIYCRSYSDPLIALREECRKRSQLLSAEGERPADYLRRVATELDAPLVIICDQFEEFFSHLKTRPARAPFIEFVTTCYQTADLPVKFLFTLRSDFLYLISTEFDGRIPEPLSSSRRYHLRQFAEAQAAEIIERSARRAQWPLEAGLSRQVARDLAVNDTVLPSELQLVGERMQSKRIITLAEYRRAGGKEQLVHSFLEEVIQASGDQPGTRVLLHSLISDDNTRLTLSGEELLARTQLSHRTVEQSLRLLVEARLVRELQEVEPWRYELMHEYLIDKINHLTGSGLNQTQRANRLLRQYLSNFDMDKHTRIPVGQLWFIRRYAQIEQSERARLLLRRSLRRGLLTSGALLLVMIAVIMLAAALLSVNETWEGARLSDGHTAAVRQIAFSPDGRILVSGGVDNQLIVWDFARRERLATLTAHTGWVTAVAFSPDGKFFASGSADQRIIVWETARREQVAVLTGLKESPQLAFSPDGRWLAATAGDPPDGRTIIWEVGRWQPVRELPRGVTVGNLFFSSNSEWLLFSNGWSADTLTWQLRPDYFGPGWSANAAGLAPDATRVAGVDGEGNVMIRELPRQKSHRHRRAHRFFGRAVAVSPDSRLVATGADDIIIWEAATGSILSRLEHTDNVWSLAFAPDNRWLVSSHGDGAILLWDATEWKRVANFNEHSEPVRVVAFAPDGKRLISAGEDHSIVIWDTARKRKETVLLGHSAKVTAVQLSPDSQELISGDTKTTVIRWDLTRGQIKASFTLAEEESTDRNWIVFSPDGRWVVTMLGVYESNDGGQIVDFQTIPHAEGLNVSGIAFSPDGQRMACVTWYGRLLVWEVEGWRLVEKLELPNLRLLRATFTPDGWGLAVGDLDGGIWHYRGRPLRLEGLLGRHTTHIQALAFSPDGRQLASASDDRTIALWDVRRRRLLTQIGSHQAPPLALAFSSDGRHLASGEQDKSVRLYTRQRSLWGYHWDE